MFDISEVLHVEWLTYRRCTSLCRSVSCTESLKLNIRGLTTKDHAALTWLPNKLAFVFFISRMPAKCCTIRGASGAVRVPTQGGELILPQIALQ